MTERNAIIDGLLSNAEKYKDEIFRKGETIDFLKKDIQKLRDKIDKLEGAVLLLGSAVVAAAVISGIVAHYVFH